MVDTNAYIRSGPLPAGALEVQEFEWSRISRILHDHVGQVLTAIGLQLDLLRMDFKDEAPQIVSRTREIQQLLEAAVTEVRDLSYEMDPASLERGGLAAALDRLIGRFRKSFKGEIDAVLEQVQISRLPAMALCRIFAQALENAILHAKCSRVSVRLKASAGGILLEVRDHGAGYVVEEVRQRGQGRGIPLMFYYASQANIDLTISSRIGKGTTVRGVLPLPRKVGERSD